MATVDELAKLLSPEVQELTLQTRELVRSVMPDGVEAVHLGWKNIWFGTGLNHSDGVFVVNPVRHGVNLNILEPFAMEDPAELLEGAGKTMRHVKIRTAAELARPELRRLLESALDAKNKRPTKQP